MNAVAQNADFTRALAAVRGRFVDGLFDRVLELEALAQQMRQKQGTSIHLKQIAHILHKLAGVAPTVGFPRIGAEARRIEEIIWKAAEKSEQANIWPKIEQPLETLMNALEDTIDAEQTASAAA